MHLFVYKTMLVTLLQQSNVINNLQLFWIPLRATLVWIWTIQLMESTSLLLIAIIASSSIVSDTFSITYHSELSPSLWLGNSLPLQPNVWAGSLWRLEYHPIISPMSSCMHRWELPVNYRVFAVVLVIYHYVERIWRILVTPNVLYNI